MRILSSARRNGCGAEINFFRAVFFVIFCAVSFAASSFAQTKSPASKPPVETKQMPANLPRVTQIDDAKIKALLKPNGKPLLVNFWATWCVPCREEFPDLVKIDADYRGKIDFFTVSLDYIEEINRDVPKFLSEMKAEMPAYLLVSEDESTLISTIAKDWSGGLPFTILYNQKGEIVYFRQGKVKVDVLRAEIEKNFVSLGKP
jgi:thiol-disulfide isomerase/thioredoxin